MENHVLITGGAGFIGSRLVGTLLSRGYYVTVVDRLDFGAAPIIGYHVHPRFNFLKADVKEERVIQAAAELAQRDGAPQVSSVVHLAATVGFPACEKLGVDDTRRQNIETVMLVYEAALNLEAERFIFSSTYSNYGLSEDGEEVTEKSPLNPQSLYAETKIAAEEYLRAKVESPCAPLIFRIATLFGTSPRMRFDLIVNQFVLEALCQAELLIYQRDYSRSFVHIQDVIEGFLTGLEAPISKIRGETFNLGNQDGNHTKEEVVAIIREALPKTKVRYGDHSVSGDMRDIRVSFAKIEEVLGFRATRSVRDGVKEIIQLLDSGLIEDPFDVQYRNARLEIQ